MTDATQLLEGDVKRAPSILAALLLLCGCSTDPISVEVTDNREVHVHVLFNHDGCRVYRFKDSGHYHYFARCASGDVTAMTTHTRVRQVGKQTIVHHDPESIPTMTLRGDAGR